MEKLSGLEWLFTYFSALGDMRDAGLARLDPDYSDLVNSFPSPRSFRSKLLLYRRLLEIKDLLAKDPSSIFHEARTPQARGDFSSVFPSLTSPPTIWKPERDLRLLELDLFPDDLRDVILEQMRWPTRTGRSILRTNKASIRFAIWSNYLCGNLIETLKSPLRFAFTLPLRLLALLFLPYGVYCGITSAVGRSRLLAQNRRSAEFYRMLSESHSQLFISDDPAIFLRRLTHRRSVLEQQFKILEKHAVERRNATRLAWYRSLSQAGNAEPYPLEELSRHVLTIVLPQLKYRNAADLLQARHVARNEIDELRTYLRQALEASAANDIAPVDVARALVKSAESVTRKLHSARDRLPRALFEGAAAGMTIGMSSNSLFSNVLARQSIVSGAVLGIGLALRNHQKNREAIIREVQPRPPSFLLRLPWKS